MSMRYFYKECFSTYYIVAGAPVPFEQLDGNRGVAVFDTEKDAELIAALDKAAGEGRGGIVRLNESGYNEKKNPLPPPLNLPSRLSEPIRVMPHDLSPHPKNAEAAANGKSAAVAADPNIGADGLRLDGPTLEEFVAAGYPPTAYPPRGYAIRTVPRWKEAGLKAPPKDEDEEAPLLSIPRPDPVIAKEQGQGSAEADKAPSNKTTEPTKPAFKPATKRLGQEKANVVPAVGTVPKAATEEPIDSEKDKTKTGNVG